MGAKLTDYQKRKGLGFIYDIIVAIMGIISFLFSYIGISMINLVFSIGLSNDAINVIAVGIFILISWYGLGIIINHRTMGPMGAVKRHFSIVANGDYYLQFQLRRGDDLKYVCDILNKMTQTLIDLETKSIIRLKNIQDEIEIMKSNNSPSSPDIENQLSGLLEKLDNKNKIV